MVIMSSVGLLRLFTGHSLVVLQWVRLNDKGNYTSDGLLGFKEL